MRAWLVGLVMLLAGAGFIAWDVWLYRDGVPRNTMSEVGTYWGWRFPLLAFVAFGLPSHVWAGGVLPGLRPVVGLPLLVASGVALAFAATKIEVHPFYAGLLGVLLFGVCWQVPKSAAGLG